ncbi:MAG TPA: hypothetical protein VM121_08055 [Acidimicrobiales bacterium]|nr:hypothetical protein [Acidimicrobiales bacterium]
MRWRIFSLTAALAIVSGAMALAAPGASAQTGYQGQCNATTGSSNAGSHNIGETFTVQLAPTCVWTPGSAVTVNVNGVPIPGKVANAAGLVSVTITVVSATQLSVDDPVSVASQCGSNSVVGVGQSSVAGGATVTHSAGFTVNCAASTAKATTGTVAFTGANVAKWSAAAFVLLAAGFALVLVTRRRKSHDTVTPA